MRNVEAQLIHDMQNTATVLREAASQLHENGDSLPRGVVAHLTEMLARRSDMLVRLLGDLSMCHLAERGELDLSLQRVSLSDVCHELIADRMPSIGSPITIDVSDDAVVLADPLRLTQVLDNLISNALRYGGPNLTVSSTRDATSVQLSVSDDGPGVPDELADTLFRAYAHGPASQSLGGSGLGLFIVRELCEAMGGTIAYDGTRGSRFTATFPAVPVASEKLGHDVAGAGHSVAFWHLEVNLADDLVAYVANGLTAGEAVVVAATPEHLKLLETGLVLVGIDPVEAIVSGQYLPLDATALHAELSQHDHIDHDRFETMVGEQVRRVSASWRGFRVFGEIVDLYWRHSDDHLALELESCWNDLRAKVPFPLLCGYELAPGENAGEICDFHDMVVSA